MGNTQYAVCHLQRGSGNDSGMSCHIERKDAKGKKYIPFNADANRTHLNRELVKFPDGVKNRTEAIQFRIDHAGLHRKVGKNQTKAIRIILTGTHEQMMKIADDGKLDKWIDANMKWLKDTFGSENLVSCVLHLDEKTPHLHATIVPIVTTERLRKKREGEKKYETKSGARLSADDVMRRTKLHEYQNSYAKTMKPFGLQRGIVGSTAKHRRRAGTPSSRGSARETLPEQRKNSRTRTKRLPGSTNGSRSFRQKRHGCRNNINQKSENYEMAIKKK